MKIKALFFASCRERVGTREAEMTVADGVTVAELIAEIAAAHPRFGDIERLLMVSVNQDYVGRDAALDDGDEVAFIPPVSGGAGDGDVYRIVAAPIAPDALHEVVRADSDGAVVTFVGVVRNHAQGRRTQYLVYEAYAEMAERKMREVGEEARARWGVDRVAVLHRVGRLEIGETAVLIAVSSAHRQAAFEACRYVIDRLKEAVPIWKKEVWVDGEAWIEGDPSSEVSGEA